MNKKKSNTTWMSFLWGCFLLGVCSGMVACSSSEGEHKTSVERRYKMTTDTLPFSFFMPEGSELRMADTPQKNRIFVDLVFPEEKARLYCTYHSFSEQNFPLVAEESRKLVYFHFSRAQDITMTHYEDPSREVYGILYSLEGKVATPLQLSLTDSLSYFFHASLYFDSGEAIPAKADTLKVLTGDLKQLMETFKNHPSP